MAETAVIAGLGPGFGEALAWKLANEGYKIAFFSRSGDYLKEFADELCEAGHEALGVPTDITEPEQVASGFERVREELGPVSVVSVQASNERGWREFSDTTVEEFRAAWEVYAFGAFLCAKHAVPDMRESGGTLLLVGTAPQMSRGQAHAYSSAKAAMKELATSLAHELWSEGIHVAHLVIDGRILNPDVYEDATEPINEEEYIDPGEAARTCWHVIDQDRSAWTSELDVRAYSEDFPS